MGTDDLFKKRRAERQKRKHEFKSVNTNSFLIVTEGEKTEGILALARGNLHDRNCSTGVENRSSGVL